MNISKKSILNYFINVLKYKKLNNNFECILSEENCYFVKVESRSKMGWYHYFYNKHTNTVLSFNMYFMSYVYSDGRKIIKLNQINSKEIENIINQFIGKDTDIDIDTTYLDPYFGCENHIGENSPKEIYIKQIRPFLTKYHVSINDMNTIINSIREMCQRSYENGMIYKS